MSIPYYIHRDDADDYDELTSELKPIFEAIKSMEIDLGINPTNWKEINQIVQDTYKPIIQTINNKYGPIRRLSAFSEEDKTEYYTYFKGVRITGEFADKMSAIAETGIKKCKKALESK